MSIKRMLCFFGRHSRARSWHDIGGKLFIYCERCRKILFYGDAPPEHPNCRCQINGPEDDDRYPPTTGKEGRQYD
jgi:hypothetical protein